MKNKQRGFFLNPFTSDRSSDPHFSNVRFLVQPSGQVGSTALIDLSTNSRTVSMLNGANLQSFAGSTSDKVITANQSGQVTIDSSGISLVPGVDFVFETRFYREIDTTGSYETLVRWTTTAGMFAVVWGDSGLGSELLVCTNTNQYWAGLYQTGATKNSQANAWHSLAFGRVGGQMRVFIDGVLQLAGEAFSAPSVTSWANNEDLTPTGLIYLCNQSPNTRSLHGYMDTARLTVGNGRYTTDYAPVFPYPLA